MIAQDVLLGRPRVASSSSAAVAVPGGGGFARALLGILFAGVILFETGTSDPVLDPGSYLFHSIGSWSLLPIIVAPLEILLLIAVGAAFLSTAIMPRVLAGRLDRPVVLFTGALVFGLIRGGLGGGDMYIGFWEVRALLYIPLAYAVARMTLRTREQVMTLLRVGLVAAVLFAIEGAYRRIALVDTGALGVIPEFAYQHEDVIFLSSFLLFVFAAHVFRAFRRVRVAGLLLSPLMLYTLLATERRAGIIVLLVGLLVIALTVLVVNRTAFLVSALPVLALTALYIALFWNASGVAGQPARAVRSLYQPDPRDAASNFYRLIETYDISETIHSDPVLGVGFGRPFLMVAPLPDLSWWPFWHFETHNSVLWIWLKTGVLGYVLLWSLLGGAVTRAAHAAKRLVDSELRAASLFCLVSIVGVVVYAYVDLGFASPRVMLFTGTILGILAVIESLDRPRTTAAKAAHP